MVIFTLTKEKQLEGA